MTMKYYKDVTNAVHAFDADGSQDAYISADLIAITEEEAAALLAPETAAMIEAAKRRIHESFDTFYRAQIEQYTGQPYSQADITSWPMQEAEAWDYIQNDVAAITQWMDAYSAKTGIAKNVIALETTQRVLWYKAMYIAAMAMRYDALTAIDALGPTPTQEQLDAIVWPS